MLLWLQCQITPLPCTWSKGEWVFLLCHAPCIERMINGIVFTKGVQEAFSPCIWDTKGNSKSWVLFLSLCFLRVGKFAIFYQPISFCGISYGTIAALHIHTEIKNLWQTWGLRLPHFMFPFPAKTISNGKAPRSCVLQHSKMKKLN